MKKRAVALVGAAALVAGCAIGGTLAWLTDDDSITNTFKPTNIEVDIDESTGEDYEMVPGRDVTKDPIVTITAGSESCYVFVKVIEAGGEVDLSDPADDVADTDFDDFMEYTVHSAWTALDTSNTERQEGVYWIEVNNVKDATENVTYQVLTDNKVKIKESVTKEMMDALFAAGESKYPTLSFEVYSIQTENLGEKTMEEIWAMANPSGQANE